MSISEVQAQLGLYACNWYEEHLLELEEKYTHISIPSMLSVRGMDESKAVRANSRERSLITVGPPPDLDARLISIKQQTTPKEGC